jgi:uncharacterized protein (TIGR00730 family)
MEIPEKQAPQKRVSMPDAKIPRTPYTRKEMEHTAQERIELVGRELAEGISFSERHTRSVTFFGSARFKENHPSYKQAYTLAKMLSEEGFAITTGGGPGIMEAANRGAHDSKGHSLGFTIRLPLEEVSNPYVNESVHFYYFFTRKVALSFAAEAYVYFPGGFGTLDELLEILTLIQTKKIPRVPVILFGKKFWQPLDTFLKNHLATKYKTIDKGDTKLYVITDDTKVALKVIKKAPIRRK